MRDSAQHLREWRGVHNLREKGLVLSTNYLSNLRSYLQALGSVLNYKFVFHRDCSTDFRLMSLACLADSVLMFQSWRQY